MGDAERAAAYLTLLVARLRSNSRVDRVYRVWLSRHGLDTDPVAAVALATFRRDPLDVDETHALVAGLGINCRPLPDLILRDFAARVVGSTVDVTPPTTPDVPADFPTGRAPRSADEYLKRDVDWYYRAHVQKAKGDSKKAIAKAAGVSRSTVQAAIDRVERLLATFDESPSRI